MENDKLKQISASRLLRAGIVPAALGITCATAATRQVAMAAFSLAIPSDWTFEGTFLPGPSCAPVPNAIYLSG